MFFFFKIDNDPVIMYPKFLNKGPGLFYVSQLNIRPVEDMVGIDFRRRGIAQVERKIPLSKPTYKSYKYLSDSH